MFSFLFSFFNSKFILKNNIYLFCGHLNVKRKILDPNAARSFFNIITYIQRGYGFKQNVKLLTCFDVDFTHKKVEGKNFILM